MPLSWRTTYDVHDCPDCGGEHPGRRVWNERGNVFVLCPRTARRIRIRMRHPTRDSAAPIAVAPPAPAPTFR